MNRISLRWVVLLLAASVGVILAASPASAQYIFIDVNGDQQCTSADVLSPSVTSFDVYLSTNKNADGSDATCAADPLLDMTINSYTFILTAPSGGVTYGTWTDNLGFTIDAGGGQAGNDVWVAWASGTALAPGTHKLGTQAVTITGTPTLQFATTTTIDPTAITSFGSACTGTNFDNTIVLGQEFNDNCGVGAPTPVSESTWGKIKNLYR